MTCLWCEGPAVGDRPGAELCDECADAFTRALAIVHEKERAGRVGGADPHTPAREADRPARAEDTQNAEKSP